MSQAFAAYSGNEAIQQSPEAHISEPSPASIIMHRARGSDASQATPTTLSGFNQDSISMSVPRVSYSDTATANGHFVPELQRRWEAEPAARQGNELDRRPSDVMSSTRSKHGTLASSFPENLFW